MQKTFISTLFIFLAISMAGLQVAEAQQGRRPASKEEVQQQREEMEQHLKNATTDADKVRLTSQLAGLVARENFDEGMTLAKKALELAKTSGDTELIARANFGCGNIAARNNRNDEALEFFKTGLPHAEKLADPVLLNPYYSLMGNIYEKRGMYEKALNNYLLSLAMLQKSPSTPELQLATRHLNIGGILDRTGKHSEAIGYYEQSAAISEKLERWDMAGGAWHNIGEAWKKIGEEALAEGAFDKAGEFMERSKKKAISPPRAKWGDN